MSTVDNEILEEFVVESKGLVQELLEMLEGLEGHPEKNPALADYGNLVDRIMGGAQSLALLLPRSHALHVISDYAAICKAVGYKGSQIKNNAGFVNVVYAFLLDATEILEVFFDQVDQPMDVLKKEIPTTFIERLKWLSQQFDESYRSSVDGMGSAGNGGPKMSQNEIDALMAKLGI